MGRLSVDRNTALQDQLLHLQARAHARLRQDFVQLGRLGLRLQHPLGGQGQLLLLLRIEDAADHIVKTQRIASP